MNDSHFPENPYEAIRQGFYAAEKDYIYNKALTKYNELRDSSGACVLVMMIIGKISY